MTLRSSSTCVKSCFDFAQRRGFWNAAVSRSGKLMVKLNSAQAYRYPNLSPALNSIRRSLSLGVGIDQKLSDFFRLSIFAIEIRHARPTTKLVTTDLFDPVRLPGWFPWVWSDVTHCYHCDVTMSLLAFHREIEFFIRYELGMWLWSSIGNKMLQTTQIVQSRAVASDICIYFFNGCFIRICIRAT